MVQRTDKQLGKILQNVIDALSSGINYVTSIAWESKVTELLIAPISLSEDNKRISN